VDTTEPAEPTADPIDPVARAAARVRAALEALAAAESAVAADAADPTLPERLRAVRSELHEALAALGAAEEQQRLQAWLDDRLAPPAPPAAPADALDLTPSTSDAALSDTTLAEVRAAIESAPFKDDKMQVLRTNLTASRVSTDQVAELLDLFSLSSHRVDALVFLHPRITDPEKFDSLLATLKFESDRKTVLDRLGLGG